MKRAKGRKRVIRTKGFIRGLLVALATLILLELLGQLLLSRAVRLMKDPDHRMTPHATADINSDGIRSTVESDAFQEADLNVIFLGDSFVFGFNVPHSKSIPHLLETKVRGLHQDRVVNVANFGWVSSSPLLSLRLLRDIGRKYNPDIVLLGLDMTDFHDDLVYSRLLAPKGIYRAVNVAPMTLLALYKATSQVGPLHDLVFGVPSRRFFVTDEPLGTTRSYLSSTRENVNNINEYCKRELGATFILFVFPRGYQYSDRESPNNWEKGEYQALGPFVHEPFKYFDELKEGHVSYPVYSLLPDFQRATAFPTCFDDDPHWNEIGNRIAVEAIYSYCLREGCFE